jgi:hypothetical protein
VRRDRDRTDRRLAAVSGAGLPRRHLRASPWWTAVLVVAGARPSGAAPQQPTGAAEQPTRAAEQSTGAATEKPTRAAPADPPAPIPAPIPAPSAAPEEPPGTGRPATPAVTTVRPPPPPGERRPELCAQQRPAPPGPPYPEDPTTATRHLCAAAYLDEQFRDTSLREVYYRPHRLVALSNGFDLVPVLAHCLRARNGALLRDAAIVAALVGAACLSGAGVLGALTALALWHGVISAYRLVRDTAAVLRNRTPGMAGPLFSRVLLGLLGLGATLAALWVVARLVIRWSPATPDSGWPVLTVLLLVVGCSLVFSSWRQACLAELGPGMSLRPPAHTPRLDEIARQQRGNTAVYSGLWPFLGSGTLIGSWGFAVRLMRPVGEDVQMAAGELAREFPETPFSAMDVVDRVRRSLAALVPERQAEAQIAGLTVEDRLFLAGTEVASLVPDTSPDVMAAAIRFPTASARHYLVCQIFAHGGELVTTTHVHVALQGRSLYLEVSTTVLPPTRQRYHVVDMAENHGAVAWLVSLTRSLAETPRTVALAPFNLVRALFTARENLAAGGALRRGYDYGARVSVRELGAETNAQHVTVSLDADKYRRLLERRVIAAVLDFLDERGVDTTEYRARVTSLLNTGEVARTPDSTAGWFSEVRATP